MEVHSLNNTKQSQPSSYFFQNGYPEWGVDSQTGSKKTSPEIRVVNKNPGTRNKVIDKFQLLVKELLELQKTTLGKARPLDIGRYGCSHCDPLFSEWSNSMAAEKGIIFNRNKLEYKLKTEVFPEKPADPFFTGIFQYERDFKKLLYFLPDGKERAAAWARKHAISFGNKNKENSRKEIDYRLKLDYQTKRLMKTEDLKKQYPDLIVDNNIEKYLPQIYVFNPNSNSTPLRGVIVPNTIHNFTVPVKDLVKMGYDKRANEKEGDLRNFNVSYNNLILMHSTRLPPVVEAHLRLQCSETIVVCDIGDFFKSIMYAPKSSIAQQVVLYTDGEGFPTVSPPEYRNGNSKKIETGELAEPKTTDFCYT